MNDLLEAFNAVSGLRAHHCAVTYHPELAIEFDGVDSTGLPFHIGSGVTDSLVRSSITLAKLQKNRILENLERELTNPMAKMSDIGQRIKALKHSLDRQTDELAQKVDATAQMAPDAFSRAHAVIDQSRKDIEDMAAEIGQVSNGQTQDN